MIKGLAKILMAGLFLLTASTISEGLSDHHYYRVFFSIGYCMAVWLCVFLASKLNSKSLMLYATLYFFASTFEFLMHFGGLYELVRPWYYYTTVNYCLILDAMDYFIITSGGINVVCSVHSMLSSNRANCYHFDARMGLLRWAK